MLLKKLIKNCPKSFINLKINGLSLNSKSLKKGHLFFALKGKKFNGEKFIQEAILNGAKAIVCSSNCKFKSKKIAIIKTKKLKSALILACKNYYNKKPKNIIAVTGTNGKTSVAGFYNQLLTLNKIPVASIGTLGIMRGKTINKSHLTSPDIISLHKELQKLKEKNIDNVIIEASSHGLQQGRLDGINFKAGIFTNFTQDHLDYHKSMKNYLNAKLILFNKLLTKKNYIISDKNNKEFKKLKKIAIKRKLEIISIKKKSYSKEINESNLVGEFQTKNLLMAILAAKLSKIKDRDISSALNQIQPINGRLSLIKTLPNNAKVFIDYAHTPDALENSLKTLKNYYKKNITLIFGCGGERDKTKRPLMAKIANKYSNKIIITDDNPRSENPSKIRKQIYKYLKKKISYNISNRNLAIKKAIMESRINEIIIIAGKGHENTQDYGNVIYKISDKEIVNKLKIKKIKKNKLELLNNYEILKSLLETKKKYYFDKICINSKEVKKNNLFLAIKGKNKDGHDFVSKAFKAGAIGAITSKQNYFDKTIKVKDTLSFLESFSIKKRERTNAKIIAITGSSGKTTAKFLLSKTLNLFGSTYSSPRSFNNHIGVPLSLSNLRVDNKFGVFEIGMSKAGEIKKLSRLIKPEIAIITNIGEAHIENFKFLKDIAKAKAEIIENIQKRGILILNRDDKYFDFLNKIAIKKNIKVLNFGFSSKSDFSIKQICLNKIKIKYFKKHIILKDINLNNLSKLNLLCCLSVLHALKLDINQIRSFVNFFKPLAGRGKIYKIKRYNEIFNLVDESYNSNPSSVKQVINNLDYLNNNSKKYIILGDMLELGNKSEFYHKSLSTILNKSKINKVFVYGKNVMTTYKNLLKKKRGNVIQNKGDIDVVLNNIIDNNDYLIIKGSNATGLHNFSYSLRKELQNVI